MAFQTSCQLLGGKMGERTVAASSPQKLYGNPNVQTMPKRNINVTGRGTTAPLTDKYFLFSKGGIEHGREKQKG